MTAHTPPKSSRFHIYRSTYDESIKGWTAPEKVSSWRTRPLAYVHLIAVSRQRTTAQTVHWIQDDNDPARASSPMESPYHPQ